jgi:hypothetical protein
MVFRKLFEFHDNHPRSALVDLIDNGLSGLRERYVILKKFCGKRTSFLSYNFLLMLRFLIDTDTFQYNRISLPNLRPIGRLCCGDLSRRALLVLFCV